MIMWAKSNKSLNRIMTRRNEMLGAREIPGRIRGGNVSVGQCRQSEKI